VAVAGAVGGKQPEGKALDAGFISDSATQVGYSERRVERSVSRGSVVGRESISAGGDCGVSSVAMYTPEILPSVVWAKFQALGEGAALATKRLWG